MSYMVFIEKNDCGPNLSIFEPAGLTRLGAMMAMLKKYHTLQQKPKTTDKLDCLRGCSCQW